MQDSLRDAKDEKTKRFSKRFSQGLTVLEGSGQPIEGWYIKFRITLKPLSAVIGLFSTTHTLLSARALLNQGQNWMLQHDNQP